MALSRHESLRSGTSTINEWKHRRAAFRLHLYRSWSSWWSENPQLGAAQYLSSLIADCRELFKYDMLLRHCIQRESSSWSISSIYPLLYYCCSQLVGPRRRERTTRTYILTSSPTSALPIKHSTLRHLSRRSPVQHTLPVPVATVHGTPHPPSSLLPRLQKPN